MTRRTLIDFFDDLSATPGNFLVYDDGYRTWSYSYADVASAARALATRFAAAGITKGETVAIWSENRPEWIVAVWGCLLEGVDELGYILQQQDAIKAFEAQRVGSINTLA